MSLPYPCYQICENISDSSATKLEPTASQSFPLHTQLRLLLMAERHIQIFEISLPQVNLRILLSNICAWLNCYENNNEREGICCDTSVPE